MGERLNSSGASSGYGEETGNATNVAYPAMGRTYTNSNLGFNYYYHTSQLGMLKVDALVSYLHGTSVYQNLVTLSYGTWPEPSS